MKVNIITENHEVLIRLLERERESGREVLAHLWA
jgi:hypothetical protein